MTDLDAELLAAHAAGDAGRLVTLYAQAAEASDTEDAAGFFYTQAYVFALETGHPSAPDLRDRLVAAGRETPLAAPQPPRR